MPVTKGKYLVLPRRHVMVGGKKRASVSFETLEKAKEFVKKRKLKGVLFMKRKKKNR